MPIDALLRRLPWDRFFTNVVTYATFPIVGGRRYPARHAETSGPAATTAWASARSVLVAFMGANALNFILVAGFQRLAYGTPSARQAGSAFVAVLPVQFATGLLTAGVAFSYGRIGVGAVGLLAVVLFVSQYLLREGIAAIERGEELGKRTKELAALQVGPAQHGRCRRCRCVTP